MIQASQYSAAKPLTWRMVGGVLLAFAALTIVSMGLLIQRMGGMGDFWSMAAAFEDGTVKFWQLDTARPLDSISWYLMWKWFGYDFTGYYVVLLVIHTLTGTVLWIVLWRHFDFPWSMASLIAAFVLLYPSNAARFYTPSINNYQTILYYLVAAWCWLEARHASRWHGRVLWCALCMAMITAAALTYEIAMGIALVFPVITLLRETGRTWTRARILREVRWWAVWYGGFFPFILFRLFVEPRLARPVEVQVVKLHLSAGHIAESLLQWPGATLWKGWLYALALLFDAAKFPVLVAITTIAVSIVSIKLTQHLAANASRSRHIGILLSGIVLLLASAFPIIVTDQDISTTVGTLFGRWLAAAAFGQALLLAGLLSWLSSAIRTSIAASVTALLLSVAVLASIGLQHQFANAWLSQLRFVAALDEYAPALDSATGIVVLDVPNGPYDARYTYLYSRLAYLYYHDKTVKAMAWLDGYTAKDQFLAFGKEAVVAQQTLMVDEFPPIIRPYDRVIGLQYTESGEVRPVTHITERSVLPAGETWFADRALALRHEPFDLLAPPDWPVRSTPVQPSPGREHLLRYCRELLDACRN